MCAHLIVEMNVLILSGEEHKPQNPSNVSVASLLLCVCGKPNY